MPVETLFLKLITRITPIRWLVEEIIEFATWKKQFKTMAIALIMTAALLFEIQAVVILIILTFAL